MNTPTRRRLTRAARKLKAHIHRSEETIGDWCLRHQVPTPTTVYRFLAGDRWRAIPVDTAILLRQAAANDGLELPIEDFASNTAEAA